MLSGLCFLKCNLYYYTMAAKYGRFETLKWLRANGCEWNKLIWNQPTDVLGANIPSKKIFLTGYTLGARTVNGAITENWNHPKKWNLYGSTSDSSWTLLDQRDGHYFTQTSHYFKATSVEAYDYFKLEILDISALQSNGVASTDQRIQLGYISSNGSETSSFAPLPTPVYAAQNGYKDILEWIKANDGPEYSEEDLRGHWNLYHPDNMP
jgi:hypothetical protein